MVCWHNISAGEPGGHQLVCFCRRVRQGGDPVWSTWLERVVLSQSSRLTLLGHCFEGLVVSWAHGQCSIPSWTLVIDGWQIVDHCLIRWLQGSSVLQIVPSAMQSSWHCYTVMEAFFLQMAFWSTMIKAEVVECYVLPGSLRCWFRLKRLSWFLGAMLLACWTGFNHLLNVCIDTRRVDAESGMGLAFGDTKMFFVDWSEYLLPLWWGNDECLSL